MEKVLSVIFLLLLSTTTVATADGKMFGSYHVSPEIPFQRALILFRDGVQTLILQSQYEVVEEVNDAPIGWVVPVPEVPEVASLDVETSHHLFRWLGLISRPHVTRISRIFLVMLFCSPFLLIILCLPSVTRRMPEVFQRSRNVLLHMGVIGILLAILSGLLLPSLSTAGSRRVEVVSTVSVGIYDVKTVRSDDSGTLIEWLNQHDFKYGKEDKAAIDSYISQGWCFVVALINPERIGEWQKAALNGLAAPLVLRFPHEKPVYPLKLTGTGGFETDVLVYLASDVQMTSRDRLTLRFAGETSGRYWEMLCSAVEPEGFFDENAMEFPYISKFRDKLTAQEMEEDIYFSPAPDNESYRERQIIW